MLSVFSFRVNRPWCICALIFWRHFIYLVLPPNSLAAPNILLWRWCGIFACNLFTFSHIAQSVATCGRKLCNVTAVFVAIEFSVLMFTEKYFFAFICHWLDNQIDLRRLWIMKWEACVGAVFIECIKWLWPLFGAHLNNFLPISEYVEGNWNSGATCWFPRDLMIFPQIYFLKSHCSFSECKSTNPKIVSNTSTKLYWKLSWKSSLLLEIVIHFSQFIWFPQLLWSFFILTLSYSIKNHSTLL